MLEKEAKEYAQGMAMYYESAHGSIPSQFEKYLRKAVEYGYNKANEWHYVKDGINPTHSYRVLVFTDEGVGFGIYGLDDKKWHTYDTGFDVIAWKEIVLPKDSE